MGEHNIIQAPEIIRRLTKTLGMRQPHVTPTLAETIQPVVIVANTEEEPAALPPTFTAWSNQSGDPGPPVLIPTFMLLNTQPDIQVRVRRINMMLDVTPIPQAVFMCAQITTYANLIVEQFRDFGQDMTSGYPGSVNGPRFKRSRLAWASGGDGAASILDGFGVNRWVAPKGAVNFESCELDLDVSDLHWKFGQGYSLWLAVITSLVNPVRFEVMWEELVAP